MPIYVYGVHSLLQDQMKYAGIENAITTHEKENYPLISVEELLKINPDYLIMSGNVDENIEAFLATYPQLSHLKCLQERKIISIDPNLISRPGPRSVDCVLELRKKPHPRSIDSVTASSKKIGSIIGCKYAEAFQIGRIID